MPALETAYAKEIAESAHWSADPPEPIEEQEYDLLAFDLWHLGSRFDLPDIEEWEDEPELASRASCL